MARFNIYTGNHVPTARISVQDHCQWIKGGLESLGHEVTISDGDISRSAMNIIFEWFQPAFAEALRSSGVDYILMMTEFADGAGGFNGRRDNAWTQRWREFVRAAHGARGIWTLFEGNEAAVAHIGPAAYLELGHEPTLEPKVRHHNFESELMFFGSGDERRIKTIQELSRRGMRVLVNRNIMDNDVLGQHLQRAHLIIDPRGPNRIPIPSVARVGRALHVSRPIAVERTPRNQGLGCYALISPAEGIKEFADFCEATLADRISLQAHAEETLARIRVEVPMKRCMERALDQTLGRPETWSRPRKRPHIPIIRFVADLTYRPGLVDSFLAHSLPSLLTRRNLAAISTRAQVTFDIFVPEAEAQRLETPAMIDLQNFAAIRTRAVTAADMAAIRAPIETVDGLDDEISNGCIRFLREHAGSDVWLIDAAGFRVFADGTLEAMLTEILDWKPPSGAARRLARILVPMLAVDRSALESWPSYEKWGDLNAVRQAPVMPNSPAELVALAAASQRPIASAGYLVEPVDASAVLLKPLFPEALAVNARVLQRGHMKAAWRPSAGPDTSDSLLSQAAQGLVIVAKPHLAELQALESGPAIARLVDSFGPSAVTEPRRTVLRVFLNSSVVVLVDGGEVDALKLAEAEERLEVKLEGLRKGLGIADSAPRHPALSPAALASPAGSVGD